MRKIVACITCDVEIKSASNIEDLENIITLLDKYDVNSTLFIQVTDDNIDLFSNSKILSNLKNHELGLHIHWGNSESRNRGLENVNLEIMRKQLENSLELSKELGFNPISFRGGGLCCTNTSLRLIKDYGFKIDSSVAAKLFESGAWFQGHTNVPYKSWYYPSSQSYDKTSYSYEDRIEILEIPVTRMIPSGRGWFPWTLTPQSPFFKFIIHEWIIKSKWEPITVITPIFHSWGEGKLRVEKSRFPLFLDKLENLIKFITTKNLEFMRFKDFYGLLDY